MGPRGISSETCYEIVMRARLLVNCVIAYK